MRREITLNRVDGKVALITGAARGQGRSHAVRLANEGANIIAVDICRDIESIPYSLAGPDDLAETVNLVRATGRQIISAEVDVRDKDALAGVVADAVSHLGRLDIVVANAGVCTIQDWDQVSSDIWESVIGVNLTGVWNTCAAAIPFMEAAGGSLILISSVGGLKGTPGMLPYAVSKHGVVGLMRVLANELAGHNIRVNSVHPTGVDTVMASALSEPIDRLAADPTVNAMLMNSLAVRWIQPEDVSDTVLFLASDEARFITGLTMTVDAGATVR